MKPKPLNLREVDMRKAFDEWYFSRDFVPHGSMITNLCYQGFKKGIEYMKQHIKSACEFYLKYKDNPRLFVYENPKYIEEINELLGENWKSIKSRKMNTLHNEIFNNWLFKLAFGDVFDGDIEEVV